MKVDRAVLNVIILSWAHSVINSIYPLFSDIFEDVTLDRGNTRIIFDISFIICILIAPSYVTLSGTRISILTSYICHMMYIGSSLCSYQQIMYPASAVLGLGIALLFVTQGQCLTENSNSRTIHRHAWVFWMFHELFLLIHDQLARYFFGDINRDSPKIYQLKIYIIFFFVASYSIVMGLREPPKKYSPGGLECIPNEKVVEPEEPREGLILSVWKPFKELLILTVSGKMLYFSILVIYTGLIQNLEYIPYSDEMTNQMIYTYVRIGEIVGALFSAFCFCNKNGDSTMIVLMGLLMLAASFFFTTMNVLQADNYMENPMNLTADKLSCFRLLAMVERFSYGFGDACFRTQIYSLLGAFFLKNSAPAFAVAGLYYCLGYTFGLYHIEHMWHGIILTAGMLVVISVHLIEMNLVNRNSEITIKKESLKAKETEVKSAKEIPPEIKMLYAGFNNNEKQEESPAPVTFFEVITLDDK